ncbi:MAG TPA: DUF5995 family protein [Mycobacteriales bacterium]|nr:DUF5995 family protein [Mycobacteriales bacterium]
MASGIDDVVDRLRLIADSVSLGDGVGQFNAVYLLMTEAIRDRLGTGFFQDAAWRRRAAHADSPIRTA